MGRLSTNRTEVPAVSSDLDLARLEGRGTFNQRGLPPAHAVRRGVRTALSAAEAAPHPSIDR